MSQTRSHHPAVAPLTVDHADQVLAIYQSGINEGNATFETTVPTW